MAVALKYPPRPGARNRPLHSNTDHVIAGMVVEEATGRSYARGVTRRVIRPLGPRGTPFPTPRLAAFAR